jgi:hypothetical protein
MFTGAVLRPRAGGKSHELAKLALKNPFATVVVLNQLQRSYFAATFRVPPQHIVTLGPVMTGALRGTEPGMLLFDNFDYMLPELFHGNVPSYAPIIISATGINF